MDSQIIIDISTENDIEELSNSLIEAFEDDKALYGEAPYGDDARKEIKVEIDKNQCYTIKIDNSIIGGVYLFKIDDSKYRLKRLWINKSNQNKGNGTRILKIIENMIKDMKVLTLDTPYKSLRNQHFYEKNGFKKIGERKIEASLMKSLDPNFTLFEYMKCYDFV